MKAWKYSKPVMKITVVLGLWIATLYLLSHYQAKNLPDTTLHPDNANIVRHGKDLYNQYCAFCHGVNLEEQPGWQDKKPLERRRAPPT